MDTLMYEIYTNDQRAPPVDDGDGDDDDDGSGDNADGEDDGEDESAAAALARYRRKSQPGEGRGRPDSKQKKTKKTKTTQRTRTPGASNGGRWRPGQTIVEQLRECAGGAGAGGRQMAAFAEECTAALFAKVASYPPPVQHYMSRRAPLVVFVTYYFDPKSLRDVQKACHDERDFALTLVYLLALRIDPTLGESIRSLDLAPIDRAIRTICNGYDGAYIGQHYTRDGVRRNMDSLADVRAYLDLRRSDPMACRFRPVHNQALVEVYLSVMHDFALELATQVPPFMLRRTPDMSTKLATLLLALPYIWRHPNETVRGLLRFYESLMRHRPELSFQTPVGMAVAFMYFAEAHLTMAIAAIFADADRRHTATRPTQLAPPRSAMPPLPTIEYAECHLPHS